MKIQKKGFISQKTRDRIIKNKNTINLTGEITSQDRFRRRKIQRQVKNLPKIAKFLFIIGFILVIIGGLDKWNNRGLEEAKQELLKTGSTIDIIHKAEAKEEIKQDKYIADYTDFEEKVFEFIIQYEGYRDKPYWDYNQWSCGYGMRCNKDTTGITKEKSKWYVIQRIRHIQERFDVYKYDPNIQVALISFAYNTGKMPLGYARYIENGYIKALCNNMKLYVYAGGQKLKGLEKRRQAECNLFIK